MEKLRKRILDICYKNKLSHLGTYFSSISILDDIFRKKNSDDVFILSAGHAAVALYAVIEKYHGVDAESLFKQHGGHPHRDEANHLYCSTGSLGLGLPVAVGRAIANPNKKVYCLISDGECAEGSIWESLRFIQENPVENIEVYVNVNGYCAYDKVDTQYLITRLKAFYPAIHIVNTSVAHYPFLRGINAHYHIMSEEDYTLACQMEESNA
mgnify:CR=1 FL=1